MVYTNTIQKYFNLVDEIKQQWHMKQVVVVNLILFMILFCECYWFVVFVFSIILSATGRRPFPCVRLNARISFISHVRSSHTKFLPLLWQLFLVRSDEINVMGASVSIVWV
jgi:hypothetical protein